MIQKRFNYEGAKIFDGEELLCCTLSIWVEQLVDLLNELSEEIEVLKQQLKIYKSDGLETINDLQQAYENNAKALSNIERLEEENKELKKQMNRLYNYFMDWHSDEMGGNQFSEMWDIVKKSEEWEKR